MPQSDDLHSLHGQANDALVRLLFSRVRDMRSGVSYISTPVKALAGRPPVPADPAKVADTRSNPSGSEGGGVKV